MLLKIYYYHKRQVNDGYYWLLARKYNNLNINTDKIYKIQ